MTAALNACSDCGAALIRHQLKSHQKLYCPARGAPGLQPKACENPARACPKTFTPTSRNPKQKYCSRACGAEADTLRRAQSKDVDETVSTEEARDELQMAAVLRREAFLQKEDARTAALVLAGRERGHELMMELLGVPR